MIIIGSLVSIIFLLVLYLCVTYSTPKKIYRQIISGGLEHEKNTYFNIFNYCPSAVLILDRNSQIKCFNREAEELTGYRSFEALGKNYDYLFNCPSPRIEFMDNKSLDRVSKTIKGKKGQEIQIIETIRILEDQSENPIGLLVSFEAAYAKAQADSQMKLIQTTSNKLLEVVNMGLIILDHHRQVVFVNEYFQQKLNFSKSEIIGKKIQEISSIIDTEMNAIPKDSENVELENVKLTTKYNQTILADLEFVIIRSNGLPQSYGISISPAGGFAAAKEEKQETDTSQQKSAVNLSLNYFQVSDFVKEMYFKLKDMVNEKKLKIISTLLKSEATLYADKSKIERVILFLTGRMMQVSGAENFVLSFTQRENGESVLVTLENRQAVVPPQKRKILEKLFESGNNVAQQIVKEHNGRLWMDLEEGLVFKFTIPLASTTNYKKFKHS